MLLSDLNCGSDWETGWMSDPRNKLQELFKESNRYSNFGQVLMSLYVQGFRCHESTLIEVESPITAFCGLNGTGKSTLLQLAAVAYNKAVSADYELPKYYIKDFIVSGTLDPTPFRLDASIRYSYWQEVRKSAQVILTRSNSEKRWLGYRRLPSKPVYFAGMGLYLPKIEVRDFVVRNATKLTVSEKTNIPERSKQWACNILNCNYDLMEANKVDHDGKISEVVTVKRANNSYSEANMGCGEGRVQHIIRILETLPEKSLVLLEEPETSLHPSAQHEFGKYLMDVCIRRRHQVFITTHSEYLLNALPSASRIYLDRSNSTIRPIKGITTSQAISLMTGGHNKALHILVEDDVAESVLAEIIRRTDPLFLKTVKIHRSGDTRTIQSVMKALQDTGLPVAAVRDGDKGDNRRENIFKLPGSNPPEIEVLNDSSVKELLNTDYQTDLDDFLALNNGAHHHELYGRLSAQITISKDALIQQTTKAYTANLPLNEIDTLVKLLKESMRR
jgi:predicted ATPase